MYEHQGYRIPLPESEELNVPEPVSIMVQRLRIQLKGSQNSGVFSFPREGKPQKSYFFNGPTTNLNS